VTTFWRYKRAVDAWVRSHLLATRIGVAILGVAVLVGAGFVAFGGRGGSSELALIPPPPPRPSATVSMPGLSSAGPTSPTSPASHAAEPSGCSALSGHGAGGAVPVHICIPKIGVNADMMQLGLNPDHSVEVPPLNEVTVAGWYKYSPAPGAVGPSVILGHVDSAQYGRGVFFELGRLARGDRVTITRADGKVATYRIDSVGEYPKSSFPTQKVYGNTPNAALRLITCGGTFDPSIGSYEDNIIAFGSLVSLVPSARS
jgi:sortase (surface protein transpeptidase)